MSKFSLGRRSVAFSAMRSRLRLPGFRLAGALWVALGSAALADAASNVAAQTNWPQTYYNEAHTNYNGAETTISASNIAGLQVLWGQGVAGGVTSFALDAGVIYAQGQGPGANAPVLVAIDAASGATLWTVTTGSQGVVGTNIAVGGGFIFAACSFDDPGGSTAYGAVCAYRHSNGHVVWHFSNRCNCLPEAGDMSPLVYSAGVLYFGYGNGGSDANEYIVAADAKTGDVLWTYVTGTANTLGPAPVTVGNGLVYFTCANSTGFKGICAVAQSNGSFAWSADFGVTNMGLTLAPNNVLYVNGGSAGEFAAVNATTGATLWTAAANSSAFPVALAKGVIYATGGDGFVHALHASNGRELWSVNMASTSSVSVANGVLYDEQQGSNNFPTAAWAVADGSFLWSTPTPASTLHPPPIIANGTLYVTNAACGSVCAYRLTTE